MRSPDAYTGPPRDPVQGRSEAHSNTARGDPTNDVVIHTVNALGEAKLIRFPAVQERVSMGRTAVYELIKAGKFPRPVKVGAASAWIDVEITRWIQELAARRDTSS